MDMLEYLAAQLRKPTGFVGRVFISRMLNKANAGMNQLTLSSLEIVDTDRILEIGFGGGALLEDVSRANSKVTLHGVDFSQEMVIRAGRKFRELILENRLKLDCASVENIPCEDGAFTKACAVNSIYFWSDPRAALVELKRVLEPGGRLVLAFGDGESMAKQSVTKHGFTLYAAEDVQQVLEIEGFSNIQTTEGLHHTGPFYCVSGSV